MTHPILLQDPTDWEVVIRGMFEVAQSAGAAQPGKCSRTRLIASRERQGTAQVVGIAQNAKYDAAKLAERQRDHGLFIAFAPAENPQVAIAVVVENGNSGSGAAAPVARKVYWTHYC
jgi:penicillin-binding protein 2